jgi:hypothetical protein
LLYHANIVQASHPVQGLCVWVGISPSKEVEILNTKKHNSCEKWRNTRLNYVYIPNQNGVIIAIIFPSELGRKNTQVFQNLLFTE